MEIVVVSDPLAASYLVADAIGELLSRRPEAVLGLATGSSPLATYAELIARHRSGEVTFAGVTAFLLDEYIGLPHGHPESYLEFIRRHFTDAIDIDRANVHCPNGAATDLPEACAAYERAIRDAGGVDLQLLGIGTDGHVGFNEPTSSLGSRTRVKTLTDQTRRDNARFFGGIDEVPQHVLTQGIGTILEARHVVLIATGASKAAPIAAAVEGPLTSMVPASAIQLHPHATVVVDEAAASRLQLLEYYRTTYSSKPAWQGL